VEGKKTLVLKPAGILQANVHRICTFTETANVDYRLLFADQGKQTALFPLVPFSVY
jgi:hypothetical protein